MLSKDEAAELLVLIEHGDENALTTLFQETKGKFHYIASKYLINKMYIEDVLSEAYLKIYKRAASYNKKFDPFAWMYEIVKNTALDFNRKFSKEEYLIMDEKFILEKKPKRNEVLYFALKELNEEEYQVAYLKIWENCTLETIAKEIGRSVSQVFRIYQSALTKLRDILVDADLKELIK